MAGSTLEIIKVQNLIKGRKLREGGYSEVFEGTLLEDKKRGGRVKTKVAIKSAKSPYDKKDFEAEAEFLSDLKHPNLVTCLGFSCEGNGSIVMELLSEGSLYYLLRTPVGVGKLKRRGELNVIMDVTNGLIYLHEAGILHRDLKSGNIILDENMRAKIGDFGTAVVCCEKQPALMEYEEKNNLRPVGTPHWAAQELLENNSTKKYTASSDIFALAIIIYEIYARKYPFEDLLKSFQGDHYLQLYQWVGVLGRRPQTPKGVTFPASVEGLMSQCWATLPSDRPSAVQVAEQIRIIQTAP